MQKLKKNVLENYLYRKTAEIYLYYQAVLQQPLIHRKNFAATGADVVTCCKEIIGRTFYDVRFFYLLERMFCRHHKLLFCAPSRCHQTAFHSFVEEISILLIFLTLFWASKIDSCGSKLKSNFSLHSNSFFLFDYNRVFFLQYLNPRFFGTLVWYVIISDSVFRDETTIVQKTMIFLIFPSNRPWN